MNITRSGRRTPIALALIALVSALWIVVGSAQGATVRVAPGETLGAIAARSGVSVGALARANGITNPDLVRAGRHLTIPGGTSGGGGAVASSGGTYRVRSGDTLGSIAAHHGTSVGAIVALNHISDPNLIARGRRLQLPGAGGGSTTGGGGIPSASYRVRSGDTLGAIAARHGTSVRALAALNGIHDPALIAVGRVLTVPGSRPGRAASTPTSSTEVASLIQLHASRYGVDPALARAIAWQESGWTQSAVSSVGAVGVMQLLPTTARWLGHDIVGRHLNPHRIEDNIEGGVAYLGWLRRHGGSTRAAVGGYYQGLASLKQRGPYDDTKAYVANVLSLVGRV